MSATAAALLDALIAREEAHAALVAARSAVDVALVAHFTAHLDVRPPEDAAQVEALARLLWEYAQNPSGPGDTFDETNDAERNRHRNRAARLVARGVRVDLP